MSNLSVLIGMYKQMTDKQIQEEIDAIFEIIQAILHVTESESIEIFPTTTTRVKFMCEEIKKENNYLC